MKPAIFQTTLADVVEFSGKGLFTGKNTSVRLLPGKEDSGIVLQRVDLPHKPVIQATVNNVLGTPRCTILGKKGEEIWTVEHLFSVLHGLQVDNLHIEVDGPEIPIGDGSALFFIERLLKTEITTLSKRRKEYVIDRPFFLTDKDFSFVGLPSDECKVTYALHFPQFIAMPLQCYTFSLEKGNYKEEIAPARTFTFYEEVAPYLDKLPGGGLDNAVVIKEGLVVNPEGLRFPDELVRHKLLDLVGDLLLMGRFFRGHVIGIRTGHAANMVFVKHMMENATLS